MTVTMTPATPTERAIVAAWQRRQAAVERLDLDSAHVHMTDVDQLLDRWNQEHSK